MRCGICPRLVLERNRNTSRMESKGIEARGLVPPRACAAELDACMTLKSAGSSVPNATVWCLDHKGGHEAYQGHKGHQARKHSKKHKVLRPILYAGSHFM